MSFIARLKSRWKLKSDSQVWIILMVFAATGTTIAFLKRPVIAYFVEEDERTFWFNVVYFILILPVYNVVLLLYGALFGQFSFFWEFEKKTFRRLLGRKK